MRGAASERVFGYANYEPDEGFQAEVRQGRRTDEGDVLFGV